MAGPPCGSPTTSRSPQTQIIHPRNLQSQSISRGYESAVSTSLAYFVLKLDRIRIGDLMRLLVRPSALDTSEALDFHGPKREFRTFSAEKAIRVCVPDLRLIRFLGLLSVQWD
jgi:hypothetical protein